MGADCNVVVDGCTDEVENIDNVVEEGAAETCSEQNAGAVQSIPVAEAVDNTHPCPGFGWHIDDPVHLQGRKWGLWYA